MRGGTSKCWVFEAEHLDQTRTSLDELLPRLFGSPDHRQIDGVGGATSTTSKAMILHRPAEAGIDVEFTFAQVGIEEAAHSPSSATATQPRRSNSNLPS